MLCDFGEISSAPTARAIDMCHFLPPPPPPPRYTSPQFSAFRYRTLHFIFHTLDIIFKSAKVFDTRTASKSYHI